MKLSCLNKLVYLNACYKHIEEISPCSTEPKVDGVLVDGIFKRKFI
jgi:hypothetical protein